MKSEMLYFLPENQFLRKKSLTIIAGSLESANSSILAARTHFKEVVGKKSGFYYNELGHSQ